METLPVPWYIWQVWLCFCRQGELAACERAMQGCISLNTDFCSKGASAARNSRRIQTHWRITSSASVTGSFCESWREPVPIQGAAGTWNLSEQAVKDLWALQGLCRVAGTAASAVSHTCTPLSNTRHYMQMFWGVFGKQLHTGTPFASSLSYSTLCNWEIWHIYPIPQPVSMLFHCTLETKFLFLPTNHFQMNGGVCGSLDFF